MTGSDSILKYHVVYCSSEDPGRPIQELYKHGVEHSIGWQSARYCMYPQTIIVQFEGEVRLRMIRILAHECKIPKEIDIYIGQIGNRKGSADRMRDFEEWDRADEISYKNANFKRIGYLSLQSNEENNFRARELKEVPLDIRCSFIKLSLHECYINDFNLYNQVGLVAMEFQGELIKRFPEKVLGPLIHRETPPVRLEDLKPDKNVSDPRRICVSQFGSCVIAKFNQPPQFYIQSLRQDLDMEAEFDGVTRERLRELLLLKKKAILEERFIEAQIFKDMEDNLKRMGAKLLELEKQKDIAKDAEDFERALMFKNEIDRLRAEAEHSNAQTIYEDLKELAQRRIQGLKETPRAKSPVASVQRGRASEQLFHSQPVPQSGSRPSSRRGQDQVVDHQHDDENSVYRGSPQRSIQEDMDDDDAPMEEEDFEEVDRGERESASHSPVPKLKSPMHEYGRDEANPYVEYDERPIKPSGNPNIYLEMAQQQHAEVETEHVASAPKRANPITKNKSPSPSNEHLDYGDQVENRQSPNGELSAEMEKLPEWEQSLIRTIMTEGDITREMDPGKVPTNDDMTTQITVFGTYTTRALHSRNRVFREAAIKAVTRHLKNFPADKTTVFTAVCQYLRKGLNDKIPPVFYLCLTLMKRVVQFGGKGVKKSVVQSQADPLVAILVNRMGDPNARTRTQCVELLTFIAGRKSVGPKPVFQHCLQVPKKVVSWRPVWARLQMLEALIPEYGLNENTESIGAVVRFVKKCLDHQNGEVRGAAILVVVEIVKVEPRFNLPRFLDGMKDVMAAEISKACEPFMKQNQPSEYPSIENQDGGDEIEGEAEEEEENETAEEPMEEEKASRKKKKGPKRKRSGLPKRSGKKLQDDEPQVENPEPPNVRNSNETPVEQNPDDSAVDERDLTEDGMCIFCGMGPYQTTAEHDIHLVYECKMLCACPTCNMVTDIPGLMDHMANECANREHGRRCTECKLMFHVDELPGHIGSRQCRPVRGNIPPKRCPFCFMDIADDDDGWVEHLLRVGCPAARHQPPS